MDPLSGRGRQQRIGGNLLRHHLVIEPPHPAVRDGGRDHVRRFGLSQSRVDLLPVRIEPRQAFGQLDEDGPQVVVTGLDQPASAWRLPLEALQGLKPQ